MAIVLCQLANVNAHSPAEACTHQTHTQTPSVGAMAHAAPWPCSTVRGHPPISFLVLSPYVNVPLHGVLPLPPSPEDFLFALITVLNSEYCFFLSPSAPPPSASCQLGLGRESLSFPLLYSSMPSPAWHSSPTHQALAWTLGTSARGFQQLTSLFSFKDLSWEVQGSLCLLLSWRFQSG